MTQNIIGTLWKLEKLGQAKKTPSLTVKAIKPFGWSATIKAGTEIVRTKKAVSLTANGRTVGEAMRNLDKVCEGYQ